MNASTPPATHASRNHVRVGKRGGDRGRTKENAAADDVGDDDGGGVERDRAAVRGLAWKTSWSCQARPGLYVARTRRPTKAAVIRSSSWRSICELAHLHPDARAVLAEDLDLGVDELLVLQHLQTRLRRRCSRASERSTSSSPFAPGPGRPADAADEVRVPCLVLAVAA